MSPQKNHTNPTEARFGAGFGRLVSPGHHEEGAIHLDLRPRLIKLFLVSEMCGRIDFARFLIRLLYAFHFLRWLRE